MALRLNCVRETAFAAVARDALVVAETAGGGTVKPPAVAMDCLAGAAILDSAHSTRPIVSAASFFNLDFRFSACSALHVKDLNVHLEPILLLGQLQDPDHKRISIEHTNSRASDISISAHRSKWQRRMKKLHHISRRAVVKLANRCYICRRKIFDNSVDVHDVVAIWAVRLDSQGMPKFMC